MRFHAGSIAALAAAWAVVAMASCKGGGSAGPEEAGVEAEATGDASEPLLCMQFSQIGDPCPAPSPVRCFPQCDAGGCFCTSSGSGPPTWVCQTDLSCVPDASEEGGTD
jgi:hypothetical protein